MESKNFAFCISRCDEAVLFDQVRLALKKRTELVSREKYPGIWKQTDRFGNRTENRTRSKIYSILCLILGIFLFVPGLAKPKELTVPLLVGAASVGTGIGGLIRNRKNRKDPFEKGTRLLISSASKAEGSMVYFDGSGMKFDTELIPYSSFEFVIEAPDIYLLFYDTRVTLLQKKDLTDSDNDFNTYLKEMASGKYYYIVK